MTFDETSKDQPRQIYNSLDSEDWLAGLKIEIDNDIITVNFVHPFFFEWFNLHKKEYFEKQLHRLYPTNIVINYIIDNIQQVSHFYSDTKGYPQDNKIDIDEKFLTDFIVNDRNQSSIKIIRNFFKNILANKNDDRESASIMLLCGAAGTGKTFIINDFYKLIKENTLYNPVWIHSIPDFFSSNIFLNHLKNIYGPVNKKKIFFIDDINQLVHRGDLRNRLISLLTINSQKEFLARDIFIFTFTGTSKDLSVFEPRLAQRLLGGIVLELKEPDLSARMLFIEKKNQEMGLGLGREQIFFLARRFFQFPLISGVLRKIDIFARLNGHKPDLEELEELTMDSQPVRLSTWKDILATVARRFGLKGEELLQAGRKPEFVLARQISMYLCRKKLGLSYPRLGVLFGGKDHSTVMHAVRKIEKLAETDKTTHNLLRELETGAF